MRLLMMAVLALALARPAAADFDFAWSTTPTDGGLVGLHLNRALTDPTPHGLAWDIDHTFAWGSGLDATLDYTYPGGVVPDLVLAYSGMLHADNLRLRADDARCELGANAGHPVLPFQLSINAGLKEKPFGGLAVGTWGYQYGLYLYNRGNTKRNTISFQNLFGLATDSQSNGTGDFRLFNWQANAPVFTVQPNNALCLASATIGFFGAPPVARPTVTGSWADGTAPKALLAALVQLGLVTDGTTP